MPAMANRGTRWIASRQPPSRIDPQTRRRDRRRDPRPIPGLAGRHRHLCNRRQPPGRSGRYIVLMEHHPIRPVGVTRQSPPGSSVTACAAALLLGVSLASCTPGVQAMDASQIEERYGVSGAFTDTIVTPDGPMHGMRVPITLANGRQGHLFIPQRQASDVQAVYLQDDEGLHPVQLSDNVSRAELTRAPAIVQARPASPVAKKRSWEKEVLIVGASAGAGTAIGALAGGKKGAAVGAAAGGVGGLIYDLMTRNKN